MKQQLNEVKQLQKFAGLIKEDYDETNLEVIISDIQSHIETSSALKTDFKVAALNMINSVEESIDLERWEDALMELEDLQSELEQANPTEYEEAFAEMFEKAIRRVEVLATENEDEEDYDTMEESVNPEGDKLVLRFLKGIAKKFDYPIEQAAIFVKERLKKLGY